MFRIVAIGAFLISACAAAQQATTSVDRLSAMRRIMPAGADCADLSWEPVSSCRFHARGATLEIWSGAYGPGATLSINAESDVALARVVRAHFLMAGIAGDKLDRCIVRSIDVPILVADKRSDLRCQLVELGNSVALEILTVPRGRLP